MQKSWSDAFVRIINTGDKATLEVTKSAKDTRASASALLSAVASRIRFGRSTALPSPAPKSHPLVDHECLMTIPNESQNVNKKTKSFEALITLAFCTPSDLYTCMCTCASLINGFVIFY
jgi:hypothetical protein